MKREWTSRRRFLKGGLVVSAAGLAGCAGAGSAGTSTPSNPVFEETSISGSDLVVDLQEDNEVDKVNLIAPDGSGFLSTGVAAGATTVRFSLFQHRVMSHYTPGEHVLVAIAADEELASIPLELAPKLEITDVEPYMGGRETLSNRGNLLVTAKNLGTGPTWMYFLGYEDAPNSSATIFPSTEYVQTTPHHNFRQPETEQEFIIEPGESRTLLGRQPPLHPGQDHCDGRTVEFSAVILTGVGDDVRRPLQATLGTEQSTENAKEICSEIEIELLDEIEAADG
ncbi:hypothetical protein HZS55_06405 [Halosimplex rubrum]|uniref:Uncharacterized protein n=1 Tax=Halosimplex rubrum TaxID=869889 RepID=A0A7D5SPQ9_9EURY|nr:hypothetical protein [Halosimplex rubrum]QLH76947.1 hypothetical protein HZS55_06405 [Halosimplex rubrum]